MRSYEAWKREKIITLATACRLFPKPPHIRTMKRWITKGSRSETTGLVEVLETFRIPGNERLTSEEAVHRFINRLNGLNVSLEEMQT